MGNEEKKKEEVSEEEKARRGKEFRDQFEKAYKKALNADAKEHGHVPADESEEDD